MSNGQLESFGLVENWDVVKSYLFPTNSGSSDASNSDQQEDAWNNVDWGWGNEDASFSKSTKEEGIKEKDKESTDIKKKADSWVQNCIVAYSPMGNVFVVAHDTKAVFFTSEWDLKKSHVKFLMSFQGELSQEDGEKITSVICVPLVSKKLTSPGAPDWTCILVGFSSGYVRMYTEHGNNLVNQLFHNQRVVSFKCRSYQHTNNATDHDQLEEIFVLYETVIVTMDGFGLFQTLRACRNHVARLQANATEATIDPPPLSYKKWQYESEKPANDCDSVGLKTPVTFDHLHTASILGGIHAKCKTVPLTSYIFISTGRKPYVTFNYAQEGTAVPVLTEIAYAVASKLKSSLISAASGWLGFGSGPAKTAPLKEKPKPQIEPATPMSNRFGLVDNGRVGQTVSVSPCKKLTAITDSLGRVILLDNNLGLAVRMWKGYREAQVGWLQVTEEIRSGSSSSGGRSTFSRHSQSHHHSSRHKHVSGRVALFLVIYAPRRGHLEVYAMQQGPKVATFNVVKNGCLLSTSWAMMGLNNIPLRGGNKPVVQCLFVDSEAQLFTLNIPFHLALCDKTRSKAKDVHLLKTLQKLVKEKKTEDITAQEILEILKEVQIQSMINQGLKILSQKLTQTGIFRDVLEKYLELFCDDDEKDLSIVFRLQSLLELYTFLLDTTQKPPEYIDPVEGHTDESQDQTILRCLHASSKEIKVLQEMGVKHNSSSSSGSSKDSSKSQSSNVKSKSVKFQDEQDPEYDSRHKSLPSLTAFLSTFSIEFDANKVKEAQNHVSSMSAAASSSSSSAKAGSSTSSQSHPDRNKNLNQDKHLKFNPKSEYTSSLGLLLFSGVLNNPSDLDEWKNRIQSSGLIPLDILLLALKFWNETALLSSSYVICMKQMYRVLIALCQLDPEAVTIEFSRVSKWWEEVRKEMTKSSRLFHIYSFALVCRGVAIDLQNESELEARKSGEKKKKKVVSSEGSSSSTAPEEQESNGEDADDSSNEKMSTSGDWDVSDWENISLDLLKWTLLLKQIEDLSLLSTVLIQKPLLKASDQLLPVLPNDIQELSVINLLDKGKGCIAELVGKWLSTIGIDPAQIPDPEEGVFGDFQSRSPPPSPEPKGRSKRLKFTEGSSEQDQPSSKDKLAEETGSEALDIDADPYKTVAYVKDLLKCLKENFSVSLSTSIIIANYCWEYCLEWNKDTNEIQYLTAAVKCVNAIPGPHIKQGMMSMMWSTFLGKKFASSVASGSGSSAAAAAAASMAFARQHKDQLTEKMSGFASYETEDGFLLNLVNFFDAFMDVNVVCDNMDSQNQSQGHKGHSGQGQDRSRSIKPSAQYARAKNHWSNDTASASLTDLAIVQSHANYQMLILHYQLALVTHFLHKFRIKKHNMKPMGLFDTKSRMMFFQDLGAQAPFSNVEVDLALKIDREEFLSRVVRKAIQDIPEEFSDGRSDYGPSSSEDGLGFSQKMIEPSLEGVRECEKLVQKCFDLGRIWGLDLDGVRITQVCELFSSGFDELAFGLINTVDARDILGSKLLVLTGMRVDFIIETTNTKNLGQIISSLSTNLSSWLKNLNYSRLRCLRFTKESLEEAARHILLLIPDTNYDYKLAEELLLSSSFL